MRRIMGGFAIPSTLMFVRKSVSGYEVRRYCKLLM